MGFADAGILRTAPIFAGKAQIKYEDCSYHDDDESDLQEGMLSTTVDVPVNLCFLVEQWFPEECPEVGKT